MPVMAEEGVMGKSETIAGEAEVKEKISIEAVNEVDVGITEENVIDILECPSESRSEELINRKDVKYKELSTGNTKVDAIISFARSKLHSAEYSGYCQAFVQACYESAGIYAASNAGSAIEAKDRWRISDDLSNIPVGACVYWKSNHVAIYLGNDRIIHTVSGVLDKSTISYVCETSLSYFTSRGKVECWGYQAGYNLYEGDTNASFHLVDGQNYYIWNHNAGRFLDLESNAEGARIVLNDKSVGRPSQMWRAVKHADGYSFISCATGYAMDVYGYSTENLTEIKQYAYHGNTNQRFKLVDRGNGYYSIHPICSGLGLDALNAGTAVGTPIIQYTYHGGNNMLWGFEPCDSTAPTINSSYYSQIDKDRFTVVANVSDNIGVTRVLFPTWRNEDQVGEDAIWHEGIKQADGTWAVTIELSSYENKEGTYITHIYAYDAAGNHVSSGLSTYIDRTPPQISDVSITNVNGSGFTVNCNVTDNKEIDRVQFPVWTDANGQDDLIIDWNTNTVVSGTCYGNNFSFRVNDSDHNYERGVYHVHIYAYDKYGNYTPHTLTYDFQGADDPTEETPDNPSEESPDDPTEETPDNPSEESPDNPSEETPDDPLEETPDNPSAEYPEEPNEDTPTEDIPDNIPDEDIPAGLWIAGIEGTGYSYTGKPIKPEVRVYHHKTLLKEKKDYTISYKNNTKANNAMVNKTAPTITITGKGNYNSKETVTFKILPKSIEDENTVISDIYANSSNKVQTPIPVVTCDGKKLKNNTDFTVEYPDLYTSKYQPYKAPGDYAILIKGKGNYTGTRMVTLSITNKNLMNKVTVSKIKEQEYTGHDITPAVTVKQGSVMLLEGSDYTIAYENNREVGTASIILTGIGRYSGEKRVIFKIKGQDIKNAVVTGIPTEIEYTGSAITAASTAWRTKPVLTMTKKLIEGKDYTVSYQKNTDKGTASILFKGINGYSGTLKKTFKITPYNILDDTKNKLSVSIQTQVAYAKGGSKPKTTVKVGNTILTEGKDYTLSYKNNKAIKSRNDVSTPPTVIIKGKGNYSGSVSVNYTIMQQSLSKMTIGIQDKVYKNQKNAYKSIPKITDIDGKVLTPGTDYEKNILYTYKNKVVLLDGSVRDAGDRVQENDIVPAGTVIVVTARGTGNYSNNSILQGEYRIVNADISKANIKIIPQIYTGKEIKLNKDAITVKIGQFYLSDLDYEIVEGSYKNNIKKGTASVTIRGVGNYGGSKTVKFTIKPKGFLWWWR